MGQKVHPTGFRLGFNKTWRSRWYADKDYAKLLHEDIKLRDTPACAKRVFSSCRSFRSSCSSFA